MSGIVLCALDIGQPEHEAEVLRKAYQLSNLEDARLDVITVIPDYGNSWVGSHFEENFHETAVTEAQKALTALAANTLGDEVNANVRHVVATGTVYEEVLRAAETDGATLIVLGSHRPALRDYLLGPNAARVVRHATCSVYVVR